MAEHHKGEDWETTIRRRINQVGRSRLLTAEEMWFDLHPHLVMEPFYVDAEQLEDFLIFWYTHVEHRLTDETWAQELAKAIVIRFNLYPRRGK